LRIAVFEAIESPLGFLLRDFKIAADELPGGELICALGIEWPFIAQGKERRQRNQPEDGCESGPA
jgi:hypothetical protein